MPEAKKPGARIGCHSYTPPSSMQAPTTLSVVLGKRSSNFAAPAAKSFKRENAIVAGKNSLFLFFKRCPCHYTDTFVHRCHCQQREIVVFSETLHPELFDQWRANGTVEFPKDERVDMVFHMDYGTIASDSVAISFSLRTIVTQDDREEDCDLYYDLGYFEHDNYNTAHELLLALNDWVDCAFSALEIQPTDDRFTAFWSAFGGRMMMEIASMIVLRRGGEVYFPPQVYEELGRARSVIPYTLPQYDATYDEMFSYSPDSPPASPPPCDEFVDLCSSSSESDSDFSDDSDEEIYYSDF